MTVHFLVGDDDAILRAAVSTLVQSLVGTADRVLMVDEFDDDDDTLGGVADARVVVVRRLDRFAVDDLAPLLAYLADPLDTTHLVLEWSSGRRPKALADALAAARVEVV